MPDAEANLILHGVNMKKGARIMDCRLIEFSARKSEERIERARRVFGSKVLSRILAFALYLLGAKRKAVASLTGMPDESVKTTIRVLLRDGFSALRDRRRSGAPAASTVTVPLKPISARQEGQCCVVDFGDGREPLRLPREHRVQVRTVLLSLMNAGLLPTRETASALGLCRAHCRELGKKLSRDGVVAALIDKRRGQTHDYRVGPEQKAEIIQQFAARAVTGQSTASAVLADAVNAKGRDSLSDRTVRWHMNKLGLRDIRETLPALIDTLKKTPDDTP